MRLLCLAAVLFVNRLTRSVFVSNQKRGVMGINRGFEGLEVSVRCDTLSPVTAYETSSRRLSEVKGSAPRIGQELKAWKNSFVVGKEVLKKSQRQRKRRKLQAWRDNNKWQDENKWQGDPDNDELPKWQQDNDADVDGDGDTDDDSDNDIPKWQREEKWREDEKWRSNNFCDEDGCPHTNSNGFRGRVCDSSCADGDPYGTNGCGAREGAYGDYCRVCYIDRDRALANDDPDDRAIMCATLLPVTSYESSPSSRRLSASKDSIPRKLSATVAELADAQSMFADATVLPYVNDLVRGNMCAFIAGDLNEADQVEVAVMSVLQFLPGMTVAVATDNAGFDAYERAVGVLPGVTVHATENPFTASLLADKYCGVGTRLIFYMKSVSVMSRQFTSKDTHSTHGDLLVVHGRGKVSYVDRQLAKQTTAVLGFQSPSFTFNTDLFLPVEANADLREVLMSELDNSGRQRHASVLEILEGLLKIRNISAVPQLMAALAYSRNTPGVWFIDPQTWVSQHLFRAASIWEIPLVKPRFTCSIDPLAMEPDADIIDVGAVLQSNLDFFTQGGECDNGYIDIRRGD